MEAKEASWGTAEVGSFDHVVPRVTPGERQQREHRVGEGTPRELALVPPLRLAFGAAKRLQVELVVTLTLTLTPTPALTPALTPTLTLTLTLVLTLTLTLVLTLTLTRCWATYRSSSSVTSSSTTTS